MTRPHFSVLLSEGRGAVGACSVEELLALRTAVLRPSFTPPRLATYAEDHLETTFHVAARLGEQVIGCATMMHDPSPAHQGQAAWRLRGMAVDPEWQGRGVGAAVLEATFALCRQHAPELRIFWCNARLNAVGFYLARGLQIDGDCFEIPEIGPHYVMWRALD